MPRAIYVVAALFDINWFFFGMGKFKLTVTCNMVIKLATVACIFIFVKQPGDLWIYISIMAVGTFLSQSVVWLFLKKYVSFIKPNWKEVRRHLKPMLLLFIPVVAVSLYKLMDKIMLGSMSTTVQLGFYENSEKIINLPMGVITAFGTLMLPRMSNMLATGENDKSQEYMHDSVKYIMLIAFALAFGIASISKGFAPVFFGDEFGECAILMIGLSITIQFIVFANILRIQYLIPHAMDRQYIISVFAGAFINVVANFILIPHFQALGAVIATVLAEIIVCVIQAVMLWKKLPILKYIINFLPWLAFGFIMFAVVQLIGARFDETIFTVVLQVACGGTVYLLCCAGWLFFTKDPIFCSVIKKFKR